MEPTKKKINYFKIIICSLFIIYLALYLLNVTGYYSGSIKKQTVLTSEQIEKFEQDVKDGKEVDATDYLVDQNKDYTNAASTIGYKVSTTIDSFLNESIGAIVKILGRLVT